MSTIFVKLQFQGTKRLAEVEPTIGSLRRTVAAYYGAAAGAGALSYALKAGDADVLALVDDGDVVLAARAADAPLTVVAAAAAGDDDLGSEASVYEPTAPGAWAAVVDSKPAELVRSKSRLSERLSNFARGTDDDEDA